MVLADEAGHRGRIGRTPKRKRRTTPSGDAVAAARSAVAFFTAECGYKGQNSSGFLIARSAMPRDRMFRARASIGWRGSRRVDDRDLWCLEREGTARARLDLALPAL